MVEILVAMFIFTLAILSITSLATSLQAAQRNNEYLGRAVQASKVIIEVLRTNSASYVECGIGTEQNITEDYSSTLATSQLVNGHAYINATCVDRVYGIKRIDLRLTYEVSGITKTVQTATYIGNGGIYQ
ncbi:hypothetical protein HY312_01090 [Candidatus Saccharibacteria bacterium]|nr:hypothetical protein [Candidatus Saccharibacteria bacterium]